MNSQKRNGMVLFLDITKPYLYTQQICKLKNIFSQKKKKEKKNKKPANGKLERMHSTALRGVE